jgi:Planctomycete cytochrome C
MKKIELQGYVLFGVLLLLIGALSMPACKHESLVVPGEPIDTTMNPIDTTTPPQGNVCNPDSVYFQNQILPLLISNCSESGCHNPTDARKGIIVTSYEDLLETVDGVTNNNWEENELMEVLFLNDPDERMPPAPNQKLSLEQVNLIATWIGQGAKNNACNPNLGGCDSTNVSFSAFVKPLFAQRCTGCHGGSTPFAGLDLSTYNGAKTVALNGKLVAAITRTTDWMPKNAQRIDACTIAKIRSWVAAGALDN